MDTLGPFALGPNDTVTNGIYWEDARIAARYIPDNSIDLIFTDPVYNRIEDYRWLAETATRVLKSGGNLIAQTGTYHLPRVLQAMNVADLNWVWMLAERLRGGQSSLFQHRLTCCWKPYVWYAKGPRMGGWVFDWLEGGGIDKTHHRWGDSPEMFSQLIERLTYAQSVILDPFTGGGTVSAVCKQLGRRYLAFEIDPATARLARERVRLTQPPLFVLEPQQLRLDAA